MLWQQIISVQILFGHRQTGHTELQFLDFMYQDILFSFSFSCSFFFFGTQSLNCSSLVSPITISQQLFSGVFQCLTIWAKAQRLWKNASFQRIGKKRGNVFPIFVSPNCSFSLPILLVCVNKLCQVHVFPHWLNPL